MGIEADTICFTRNGSGSVDNAFPVCLVDKLALLFSQGSYRALSY